MWLAGYKYESFIVSQEAKLGIGLSLLEKSMSDEKKRPFLVAFQKIRKQILDNYSKTIANLATFLNYWGVDYQNFQSEASPLPSSELEELAPKKTHMTNWKKHGNPFLDFTEEITHEWIKRGFAKETCKEWLNIGLNSSDADYAQWLQDIVKFEPEYVLNYGWDGDLREQYKEYLENQGETIEIPQITNNHKLNLMLLQSAKITSAFSLI